MLWLQSLANISRNNVKIAILLGYTCESKLAIKYYVLPSGFLTTEIVPKIASDTPSTARR